MTSFKWADAAMDAEAEKFILPEKNRPDISNHVSQLSIPIVDMSEKEPGLVQKVSRACEEFGFFQIINHGVSPELCRRTLDAATEFFLLPSEEKAAYLSDDPRAQLRVFSRQLKIEGQENKMVNMWGELLFHSWHPTHLSFTHRLPQNPPQYREVIVEYGKEMGALILRLLSLISQGLGLEKDYLKKRLGQNPKYKAQANYYPPCSHPELTLGLDAHTDPNLLTVLLQSHGVIGLQVMKDEKWAPVDPVPHSFVINLGDQMQVLSNGRYKSVLHRVVTNKHQPRVSMAMFHGPDGDAIIGPIEDLIDEEHPPLYRSYKYIEFIREVMRHERNKRAMNVFEFASFNGNP